MVTISCLGVVLPTVGHWGGAHLRAAVRSILFTELPLLQRPAAAKAAGFDGVEFWWPWDATVPSDKEAVASSRSAC